MALINVCRFDSNRCVWRYIEYTHSIYLIAVLFFSCEPLNQNYNMHIHAFALLMQIKWCRLAVCIAQFGILMKRWLVWMIEHCKCYALITSDTFFLFYSFFSWVCTCIFPHVWVDHMIIQCAPSSIIFFGLF